MKHQRILLACLCVLLAVAAAGCGKKELSFEEKQAAAEEKLKQERAEQEKQRQAEEARIAEEKRKEEEEKKRQPKSPLSGLPMKEDLTNRRSVGIMISNIEHAGGGRNYPLICTFP